MLLCTVTIPLPKRCMCWLSGTKRKPGTRLARRAAPPPPSPPCRIDRKSTRLNSSHSQISYAVFCLQQKIRRHGVDDALRRAAGKAFFRVRPDGPSSGERMVEPEVHDAADDTPRNRAGGIASRAAPL